MSEIKINGNTWLGNREEIIIGSKDSITFIYEMLSPSLSQDKFLYRIILKDDRDSNVRSASTTFANFNNLPEGKWIFEVGATDLKGSWEAIPYSVLIDVDNNKRNLQDIYSKKLDLILSNDSSLGLPKTAVSDKILTLKNILIFAAIILLALISLIFFVFKPKEHSKSSEETMAKFGKSVSFEEFEKISKENIALKEELDALHGQMNAIQNRSVQLQRQNAEMQKSLAKIEDSKIELEELQNQKDDLFAIIIHDIKNPVSLIKSLVELLSSYDLTATEQQEVIQDIANTTQRIVSLSQEVSKVLSFENKNLELHIDQYDIGEIAADVFQRNIIASKNKNIAMSIDILPNLPPVECDAQKIDEVIDNLISNAIKFTPPGGSVLIKAEQEGSAIKVSISDNGLGLSEYDIKEAFKKGSKLTAKPTAGESSTGLGLWIVKKLIEAHKGTVWIKSAIGKGSTFSFRLPLQNETVNKTN